MRYINLLHRSHLVALALALTFAAGAALAVDEDDVAQRADLADVVRAVELDEDAVGRQRVLGVLDADILLEEDGALRVVVFEAVRGDDRLLALPALCGLGGLRGGGLQVGVSAAPRRL